ncbi:hypothetical protein D3C72_1941390 [compost metagenome]
MRRNAAQMPMGSPNTTPITMAAAVSCKVQGSTSATSCSTVRPLAIDTPKSPVSMSPRKRRYCTWVGRSSPRRRRRAARASALAWSPSMTAAGSPGTRRTRMNTAVSIASKVGIASSRRLMA